MLLIILLNIMIIIIIKKNMQTKLYTRQFSHPLMIDSESVPEQ